MTPEAFHIRDETGELYDPSELPSVAQLMHGGWERVTLVAGPEVETYERVPLPNPEAQK